MSKRKVLAFVGVEGCVDRDTEYLSEHGWKPIKDYNGEKIAVYYSNGQINFELPVNYMKYPASTWYNFKSQYGLDMKLSGEHNIYYITSKGNLYHSRADYIYNQIKKNKEHKFSGKLISTVDTINDFELKFPDNLIRLIVAVQADGSIIKKSPNHRFSINLKKERKKERIEYLLNSCKIPFTRIDAKENSKYKGFSSYRFNFPEGVKEFPSNWFILSKRQLAIIADEAILWDGRFNSKRKTYEYYSNNKFNADLIQFAFMITYGFRTSISVDKRYLKDNTHYRTPNFRVYTTHQKYIGIYGKQHDGELYDTTISEPSENELKYCFTTSTGMWLMRRNNNIVVTGNSGKDYSCQRLLMTKGFEKAAFADCLRDIAFSTLGIPFSEGMLKYEELKQQELFNGLTFRNILENLGSAVRKYDEDFWARTILTKINNSVKNICISDLRYPNEYRVLKKYCEANDMDFKLVFTDYHSDRYKDDNPHESAHLANYLKSKGYKDQEYVDEIDIANYELMRASEEEN